MVYHINKTARYNTHTVKYNLSASKIQKFPVHGLCPQTPN